MYSGPEMMARHILAFGLFGNPTADIQCGPKRSRAASAISWWFRDISCTHARTHARRHAGRYTCLSNWGVGGNCGERIAPQLGVSFWIDVGRQVKGL